MWDTDPDAYPNGNGNANSDCYSHGNSNTGRDGNDDRYRNSDADSHGYRDSDGNTCADGHGYCDTSPADTDCDRNWHGHTYSYCFGHTNGEPGRSFTGP